MSNVIRYAWPASWIVYDLGAITPEFIEAKAAIASLRAMPYQRQWLERLQSLELKREVAGTSRIEGAEFTEAELEEALSESPAELHSRSQRQARAAVQTYKWIAVLPEDKPLAPEVILEIHRRIVTGCDDDHCVPGKVRGNDENVLFGHPRHRGVDGGVECTECFEALTDAMRSVYREHDPVIQALASHYHIAAMHPFLDGNGRTARALEALMLQRAGLKDICFISMSNYYYEEKSAYLNALSETRANDHDLTPFLKFAMRGIRQQCNRVLREIQTNVAEALYRNVAHELFGRLLSPRKRVIAERQLAILDLLLIQGPTGMDELMERVSVKYGKLKHPIFAFTRDLSGLLELGAIEVRNPGTRNVTIEVRLEWPREITENDFFERIKHLPKAKTMSIFST